MTELLRRLGLKPKESQPKNKLNHMMVVVSAEDLSGHPSGLIQPFAAIVAALPLETQTATVYVPPQEDLEKAFTAFEGFLPFLALELSRQNLRFVHATNEGPADFLEAAKAAQRKTAVNTGTAIALRIGGDEREDIVTAVKKLQAEKIPEHAVTEELLSRYMPHAEIPKADFVLFTSSRQSPVNGDPQIQLAGLAWRTAYAEFGTTPLSFKEIQREDLEKILAEQFYQRQRKFGAMPSTNGKS